MIIFKIMNMIKTYHERTVLLKALAHPVRLAILDILREGEQCVCHVEALLGLRQSYISQHLMLLREAGLVADRREGWNIYYRVTKPEIYIALDGMGSVTGEQSRILPKEGAETCPCPKCQST